MAVVRNSTVSNRPTDLLERLDRIMAELAELRDAIAGAEAGDGEKGLETPADDLAPDDLLDTHAASARFNYPANTLAKWARTEGLGVKRGGRWLISIPRLRRRLNGKPEQP